MKVSTIAINKNLNKSQVQYKGKSLHILDGGAHGGYIKHFADSAMNGMGAEVDVKFHNVATNPKVESIKQLSDLEAQIKDLNYSDEIKKGDYVAIPGLASVSLLNLQERLSNVLGGNFNLNSSNVKAHKNILMSFLANLYYRKDHHDKQIQFMDGLKQDMGSTFGVIQEINNLTKKGVNVYLPAGHPDDNSIKWLAGQRNQKENLYKAISSNNFTPEVKDIINTVRNNGWYDFNLLALSDAHIVNVKDKDGKDYLFASRDGFVNDSARGVYNFTPVRDGWGNIKGYSYRDEHTVEYPYEEFSENNKIANINKFVGLNIWDVAADSLENKKFKERVQLGLSTAFLPDKLYKISEVFSQSEIERRKLNLLGDYITNDQKLVFDINSNGKVLFQKCNCEGSEKPSVKSMWGCCFSTVSAIARDIKQTYVDLSNYNQERDNRGASFANLLFSSSLIALGVGGILASKLRNSHLPSHRAKGVFR